MKQVSVSIWDIISEYNTTHIVQSVDTINRHGNSIDQHFQKQYATIKLAYIPLITTKFD